MPNVKLRPAIGVTLHAFIWGTCYKVKGTQPIYLELAGSVLPVTVHVVSNLSTELLLGMPFLREHKCTFNFEGDSLEFKGKDNKLGHLNLKTCIGSFSIYSILVTDTDEYMIPESEFRNVVDNGTNKRSDKR